MKKFQKLGAALLAVCLMASVSTTAFAADFTAPGNGNTTVTAKTTIPGEPAYTVTIPTTIPVGNIEKTETNTIASKMFEVKAESVADLGSKKIDVTISTADTTFNLISGSNKLPYKVYNTATGGEAIVSGGVFHSFTAAETVTGRVDIDRADIPAAGEYSGTLTFTIALVDATN